MAEQSLRGATIVLSHCGESKQVNAPLTHGTQQNVRWLPYVMHRVAKFCPVLVELTCGSDFYSVHVPFDGFLFDTAKTWFIPHRYNTQLALPEIA